MTNKYVSLATLKAYASVLTTEDDELLQSSLNWAEAAFERLCGSAFDRQAETNVEPLKSWVDRRGWLHLVARERGPVVSVSSVTVLYRSTATSYTVTFETDRLLLPPQAAPPVPVCWHVYGYPSSALPQAAADDIVVKWTYTGGYLSTPPELTATLLRMATWKYKLREAPLGRVLSAPFGAFEVIPSLPNDLRQDVLMWTRVIG